MTKNLFKDKKILIIEDEVAIADLMEHYLCKEGFKIKIALDGQLGLNILEQFEPNLIILDLMLPDMDGLDICKQITKKINIPIIMVTAKTHIKDKLLGLEYGADDYITKPFDMRELIMRIKTIFRRIDLSIEDSEVRNSNEIKLLEDIIINEDEHTVCKNGEFIQLAPKEYELLAFLAINKGRVFSRDQLLDKVWGFDYFGDRRTVDIHVQRLRKKLRMDKKSPLIETVFGVGYKINKI